MCNFDFGITKTGIRFCFDKYFKEAIESYNWIKKGNNIYCESLKMRLDYFILKQFDKNLSYDNKTQYIHHINGDNLDCRLSNLEIKDKALLTKRKNTNNKNGLTGLIKKNNKFVSKFNIDGYTINSQSKNYEEAYLDNLIIQKFYGLKHNESEFYKINDLSEERVSSVLNLISEKVSKCKQKEYKITCKNIIELSNDKNYYNVYCNNGNSFKISLECIDMIKTGTWNATTRKDKQDYVIGRISKDGMIIVVPVHRFLMGLIDECYSEWHVDHVNGDKYDNRLENLIITNHSGNMKNKNSKKYRKNTSNTYTVYYFKQFFGEKTFKTEDEATVEYNRRKEIILKNRLCFKDKQSLDEYLKSK